jgi:hypothetical protein
VAQFFKLGKAGDDAGVHRVRAGHNANAGAVQFLREFLLEGERLVERQPLRPQTQLVGVHVHAPTVSHPRREVFHLRRGEQGGQRLDLFDDVVVGDEGEDDGNICFRRRRGDFGDAALVVGIIFEGRVDVLFGVRDGLTRLEHALQTRLARDVADVTQATLFRLLDERVVSLLRDGVVNFDRVVTGLALLFHEAAGFVGLLRRADGGAAGVDGRPGQFPLLHVPPPQQIRRSAVQVEDRGDAVGEVERKLGGRVEVHVHVHETGQEVAAFALDARRAARHFRFPRRADLADAPVADDDRPVLQHAFFVHRHDVDVDECDDRRRRRRRRRFAVVSPRRTNGQRARIQSEDEK